MEQLEQEYQEKSVLPVVLNILIAEYLGFHRCEYREIFESFFYVPPFTRDLFHVFHQDLIVEDTSYIRDIIQKFKQEIKKSLNESLLKGSHEISFYSPYTVQRGSPHPCMMLFICQLLISSIVYEQWEKHEWLWEIAEIDEDLTATKTYWIARFMACTHLSDVNLFQSHLAQYLNSVSFSQDDTYYPTFQAQNGEYRYDPLSTFVSLALPGKPGETLNLDQVLPQMLMTSSQQKKNEQHSKRIPEQIWKEEELSQRQVEFFITLYKEHLLPVSKSGLMKTYYNEQRQLHQAMKRCVEDALQGDSVVPSYVLQEFRVQHTRMMERGTGFDQERFVQETKEFLKRLDHLDAKDFQNANNSKRDKVNPKQLLSNAFQKQRERDRLYKNTRNREGPDWYHPYHPPPPAHAASVYRNPLYNL